MGIKKILIAAFSAGVIMSLASVSAMADSTGWKNDGYGWRYYTSDTECIEGQWKSFDGNWYYFMDDGYALTDSWAYIDHKMYHFDSNGHMEKNKWIACGEHKFEEYETNSKICASSKYYKGKQDYRYVGSDGAAYIGWKKIDGSWYYFSDDKNSWYKGHKFGGYGLMKIGWFTDKDGSKYCFDGNGKMITGWFNPTGNVWFYFGSDGRTAVEWTKINGEWYWFNEYYDDNDYIFNMATGIQWTNDHNDSYGYVLFSNGGKILKGWQQYEGDWYYSGSDGYLYSNQWLKYNGNYFYFNDDCKMVKGENDYFIEGRLYNFNSNGACTNNSGKKVPSGWYEIKGAAKPDYMKEENIPYWVYIGSDGEVYREKWLNYGGAWYYFLYNGQMANDHEYVFDGDKVYEFGADGKCKDPDQHYVGWHSVKDFYQNELWFYYGSDNRLVYGWKKINNKWYYFDIDCGIMTKDGIIDWGEGWYSFDEDGVMQTGWHLQYDNWHYSDSSGHAVEKGWYKISGKWYYFEYFTICYDNTYVINDKYYDFDENGVCTNPEGRPIEVVVIRDYYMAEG